jgi:hypothetical protein
MKSRSEQLVNMQGISRQKRRRSFELYVLIAIFLITAWIGFLRVQQGLFYWKLLGNIVPGPAYIVATGAVYGIVALAAAIGMGLGKWWASLLARGFAIGMAAGYWLDWLLVTRSQVYRTNWPFELALTLFLILFTFAVLLSPAQREFFMRVEK